MSDRSRSTAGGRYRRTLPRVEARNGRRRRLACLCTGVASLVLLLVASVLQVVEGSWFPLLTTAAAFVLQVRYACFGRFACQPLYRTTFVTKYFRALAGLVSTAGVRYGLKDHACRLTPSSVSRAAFSVKSNSQRDSLDVCCPTLTGPAGWRVALRRRYSQSVCGGSSKKCCGVQPASRRRSRRDAHMLASQLQDPPIWVVCPTTCCLGYSLW